MRNRKRRHRIPARSETAWGQFQNFGEAIQRAKEARTKSSASWRPHRQPRAELSKYAPRIETIKINPEKIGALIGPGGKTIKGIVAETGAEINIEDDGSVHIYATSGESMARAKEIIGGMTARLKLAAPIRAGSFQSRNLGHSWKFFPARMGSCTFPSWPTSG